jgi:co-chaperonin GroES (HSP10)
METKLAFDAHKIKSVRPLHDGIIVTDMGFEERISSGGIVIVGDDKKSSGIRPRWGRVYAVGPEQEDVTVGQYVLVAHGRWTRGINVEDQDGRKTIRRIDPKDILLVSDEPMEDETLSDKNII